MLAYLLDANFSFVFAEQLLRKQPEMGVQGVYRWSGGAFVGQRDALVLRAATEDGLCLVTYDLKTIPSLLAEMAADNEPHAGVLFADDSTIRNNDFGGQVNALLAHWNQYSFEIWTNRIAYLSAASSSTVSSPHSCVA